MRITELIARRTEKIKKSVTGGKYTSKPRSVSINYIDKLDLSTRILEIRKARALAREAPDIREELVGEITKEIEEDRYNVSGAEIANKMLLEHQAVAGRAPNPYY